MRSSFTFRERPKTATKFILKRVQSGKRAISAGRCGTNRYSRGRRRHQRRLPRYRHAALKTPGSKAYDTRSGSQTTRNHGETEADRAAKSDCSRESEKT